MSRQVLEPVYFKTARFTYKADVDYLRLLHLASKNLESDVEAALSRLLEQANAQARRQ